MNDLLIGNCRAMQNVCKDIGRIAARPVTVLICGEPGTGKKLVARTVLQHGDRAGRPFIAVNCAAIPEALLESELFGGEPNGFATPSHIGKFQAANGGTILLEGISQLSLRSQAMLLRPIEDKTIRPAGGRDFLKVDVRVIVSSDCDLACAVRKGEFRENLYYLLNEAVIRMPPLRDRCADIPQLVQYFMQQHIENGGSLPPIASGAVRLLQSYAWPENVRELKKVVQLALPHVNGSGLTAAIVKEFLFR